MWWGLCRTHRTSKLTSEVVSWTCAWAKSIKVVLVQFLFRLIFPWRHFQKSKLILELYTWLLRYLFLLNWGFKYLVLRRLCLWMSVPGLFIVRWGITRLFCILLSNQRRQGIADRDMTKLVSISFWLSNSHLLNIEILLCFQFIIQILVWICFIIHSKIWSRERSLIGSKGSIFLASMYLF